MRLGQTSSSRSGLSCLMLFLTMSVVAPIVQTQERVLTTLADASVQARAIVKGDRVALQLDTPNKEGTRELALDPSVRSVLQLVLSPRKQRIGDVGGGVLQVAAVDVSAASVATAFYAFAPAVSPSGRFVAYEQSRPRNAPNQSATYGVLDLEQGSGTSVTLAPQRVYPNDTTTHQRQSPFFWLTPDTVVFLDMADEESRVVAVRLGTDGTIARVEARPLDVSSMVNEANVDGDGPPASALYGPNIVRVPGEGFVVRLKFPAEYALKVRRVDVRFW